MLEARIRDLYLVDELQLDQRLNQALQGGHQAEFALLLAMLSPDVTDAPLSADAKAPKQAELDLRKRFELPPAQPSYAGPADYVRSAAQSEVLATQGLRQVFLGQCLQRDPLVPMKHDLSPEVYNDLPPLSQEKVRRAFAGEKVERLPLADSVGGFAVLGEIQEAAAAL